MNSLLGTHSWNPFPNPFLVKRTLVIMSTSMQCCFGQWCEMPIIIWLSQVHKSKHFLNVVYSNMEDLLCENRFKYVSKVKERKKWLLLIFQKRKEVAIEVSPNFAFATRVKNKDHINHKLTFIFFAVVAKGYNGLRFFKNHVQITGTSCQVDLER